MRVRSLASTTVLAVVAAGFTALQQPAMAAGATTLYVDRGAATCTDSGSGTQAAPYCTIQAAANAAVAGDTVLISGDATGYSSYGESVVISNSGTASAPITFEAAQSVFDIYQNNTGLRLEGSYIDIEGAAVGSVGSTAPAIIVSGSNDVLDRSSAGGSGSAIVQLTSTAMNDTIERSSVTNWNSGQAVEIDAGSRNITVSTDHFGSMMSPSAALLSATGTTGLNIAGNTVPTNCGPAISLTGVSQASVENNVVVPSTFCSTNPADVVVDSASTSSTTIGYNIFATANGNAAPYSWGGTTYSTQAAFQTATGQGTADIDPATFDLSSTVIATDNPAIDSANSDAPGELATDISGAPRADNASVANTGSGTYSYYDRGAIEYQEFAASGVTAYDYLDEPQRVTVGLDLHGFAWGQSATFTITWGDGQSRTGPAGGETGFTDNHMYAARGTYPVVVTVTDDAQTVSKTLTVVTQGSDYVPVAPTRVLDTRNGTGAPQAKVAANGTVAVDVTSGVTGAPATSTITAVVLNVTVTNPAAGGYITAYPDGTSRPKSSNLNFSTGETVPNLVTVKVRNGKVDLYNGSGGTSDLIADVQGYYVDAAGSGYAPLAPTRVLDTRKGIGAPAAAVAPGGTVVLKAEGVSGVPASGVSAIAVNVTVTAPTGGGYVTVYPDGTAMPKASNLNYSPGETVPNMVIVKVGSDGEVDFHNTSSGTVQLIADVAGYYSTTGGDALVPTDPQRLLDTRNGTGQESANPLPVAPESNAVWFVSDEVHDETALVLNVTVTNPKAGGYITAYPSTASRPTASNLNFSAGETVPNMVMVSAAGGTVDLFNASAGTTDLIADMFGYFS